MTIPERPPAALHRQLVILFAAGLVLASICNGAVTYLKRVGVIDHASYQAYWRAHCDSRTDLARWTLTASCPCEAGQDSIERPSHLDAFEQSATAYLYLPDEFEVGLKLLKDVLGVVFILMSLQMAWTHGPRRTHTRSCQPLLALAAVVLLGFVISWLSHGSTFAVAGLRPYLFLAVAFTGTWAAGDIGIFARFIALLLGLEALLMPLEFAYGMHIHGHFGDTSIIRRLSGTLVAPNSFGIFAVSALAFHHAFSDDRKYFKSLAAITALLVAASGSATALVGLLLFFLVILTSDTKAEYRAAAWIGAAALGGLMMLALPTVTGRSDVFDSVLGAGARLDEVASTVRSSNGLVWLFGSGLGVGSNVEANLFQGGTPAFLAPSSAYPPMGAESGVVALLQQSGLAGLLAFYLVLAWASWKDGRTRFFYLVVAVSGLTAKITELFPVNFLLGLALAHSVQAAALPPGPVASRVGPKQDSG